MKSFLVHKSNMVAVFLLLTVSSACYALQPLTDAQLANKTAQGELITVKTIGANQAGNPNPNVGFTRLTINSKLELNSNINKLRLGCDDNALTQCDISIDKVGLTGFTRTNNSSKNPRNYPRFGSLEEKKNFTLGVNNVYTNTDDGAVATDFVMRDLFLEFAIQNPDSLTNRKMVGFRMGAHDAWGVMSLGEGPTDANGNPIYNNDPNAHTGINSLSGRIPQRLDNGLVKLTASSVKAGVLPLEPNVKLKSAITAAKINVSDVGNIGPNPQYRETSTDGKKGEYLNIGVHYDPKEDIRYLRNVWLGDQDTMYSGGGGYVGDPDQTLRGRALEFKRGTQANLKGLVVEAANNAPPGGFSLVGALAGALGSQIANQTIDLRLLHQLEIGEDKNGNLRADEDEYGKHLAFQFQTLDGLQWQTTDNSIKVNGNNDWLSTRAGWWLEQPLSTIRDFYVPENVLTVPVITVGKDISLGNLDLGGRPVDNCYGGLTFC